MRGPDHAWMLAVRKWSKEEERMGDILGVNARTYPMQRGTGDDWELNPPTVLVVLVAGEIGDYAAYAGIGSREWVARHGDKIPFDEACVHFPGGQLERARYRA